MESDTVDVAKPTSDGRLELQITVRSDGITLYKGEAEINTNGSAGILLDEEGIKKVKQAIREWEYNNTKLKNYKR